MNAHAQRYSALAELRLEIESGMRLDADTATFGQFAQMWHDGRVAAGEIGRGSLNEEQLYINRFNEHIGEIPIKELEPTTIEATIAAIKKKYELGNTTTNAVFKKCKQILKEAVHRGYCLTNPADKLKAPRRDEPERRAFEISDFGRLMSSLDNAGGTDGRVMGIRIAAATGMRVGEVLGLEWRHIDLKGNALTIEQSITPFMEIKTPKTRKGIRRIALDLDTVAYLKKWKENQERIFEEWELEHLPTTPIITDSIGNRHDYCNHYTWRSKYFKKHNLDDYTTQELRHTQAIYLLGSGADIKTVQNRLGHKSATMTLDQYGHAMPERDQEAAMTIGSIMSAAQEKTLSESQSEQAA